MINTSVGKTPAAKMKKIDEKVEQSILKITTLPESNKSPNRKMGGK